MQFGYCANANFLVAEDPRGKEIFEGILAAGYDYLETQLTHLLALAPEQYETFKRRLAEANVPCRMGMMIFPYSMPLVSMERDLEAIEAHATRTLALAADLGCETVVFGHGGARAVPDGMDYDTARNRLIDVLRIIGNLATMHNLKIAIEPLCDTNMITSFPEAAALAKECGSSVGAVFDLYHAAALGQSPMDITKAPEQLFHLHIANPKGRTVPASSDDISCYNEFAAAARQCNYAERLSVEADIPPDANIAQAIAGALNIIREIF